MPEIKRKTVTAIKTMPLVLHLLLTKTQLHLPSLDPLHPNQKDIQRQLTPHLLLNNNKQNIPEMVQLTPPIPDHLVLPRTNKLNIHKQTKILLHRSLVQPGIQPHA